MRSKLCGQSRRWKGKCQTGAYQLISGQASISWTLGGENTFQGKNLWLFVVCLSAHTTMCRFPLWVPSAFPFPLNQLIKPVSNAPRPNLGCFSQDKKCDKKCLFISLLMVVGCETYFQAEWMSKLSAVDLNSQFLRVPPHSSSSSLSLASLAASC